MKTLIAVLFFLCISPNVFAQSKNVKSSNEVLLTSVQKDLPKNNFKWKYIVIHHTANEWSSWKRIDRYHRKKFNDPDGIEYHFLIGNGKKSGRGEIELGRWISKIELVFSSLGEPDILEKIILHVTLYSAQKSCENEGLTKEQAACFKNVTDTDLDTWLEVQDCPAIVADQPSWLWIARPPEEERHKFVKRVKGKKTNE